MISRDLTLTITDTNVSLDKTIILYRYDRGITLNIALKSPDTYDLAKEITKARAIILRPNKKLSATPITEIRKDVDTEKNTVKCVYVLYLDDTWTDHLGEVGTYQIQLQLYSDKPNDECITIAPFSFEVKNPIGVPQDSAAYVGQATASNYAVSHAADVPTGDLENGEYLKTNWIDGDLITSGKLNKVETAIDYLVTDSITYAASNDIPSNVSQLRNDAGYLTEHQSLEGYATEKYVDKLIGDINTVLDVINGEIIPDDTEEVNALLDSLNGEVI